jgi:hypothetical protein
MNLMKHKGQDYASVPKEDFFRIFDEIKRSWVPYKNTISLWQKHFDKVFVGFFEDLKEVPEAFYESVCRFLDIDESLTRTPLSVVVNKGAEIDIPELYKNYLINQYRHEIIEWSKSNSHPRISGWKSRYG